MAIVKKQIKTKVYLALRPVSDTDKVPPQAKLIVKTLIDGGGKMKREELVKLLSRSPEDGGLTTNQTPERILGFYKPKLVEIGILREDSETIEVDVEVPDKPAKPEKPAKAEKPAEPGSEPATAPASQAEHTKAGKGKKAAA